MKKVICKIICFFIPSRLIRQKVKEYFGVRVPVIIREYYGSRKIYADNEAQQKVLDVLNSGKPCLIGRFGGTEYSAFEQWLEIENGIREEYSPKIQKNIALQSGFFPAQKEYINHFGRKLKEVVSNADIMAMWFIRNEENIMDIYCPNAQLIRLDSFSPITYSEPWSQYLNGKKVLVIHPFEASIKQQYNKREHLFDNPKILPEFELKTIKAVQSIADAKDDLPFNDWFEALDYMKRQIDKVDFDVAIVGAGAYGIFLADYCKRIGKQAIHLAGATQMLFGIAGRRWQEDNRHQGLFNSYWCTPMESEKPKGADKVEGGCYW